MSQGVPLKIISELMGQGSIEVTADIYLRSLDVQVRDTARSVEKALVSSGMETAGADTCPTCGRPRSPTDRVAPRSERIATRIVT
jgi:methionyl-tRNA synthetase